jgi:hypothetical protein
MATQTSTTKIPAPLYAAAGAGDLAYEQLRKLPSRVVELRDRAAELRPVVTEAVSEASLRVDLAKLRKAARRNANAFVSGAASVYGDLIARGESVVRSNMRGTRARVEVTPGTGTLTAQVKTGPERPTRKTTTTKTTTTRAATSRAATSRAATTKAAATKPAERRTPAKRTPAKRTTTKASRA